MHSKNPSDRLFKILFATFVTISCVLAAGRTTGFGQDLSLKKQFGDLQFGDQGEAPSVEKVALKGDYKLKTGTPLGILSLRAKIAPKQHVYSVTQKSGGPMRSRIGVIESDQFSVIGEFAPDKPPHVEEDSASFDVPVEHHEDAVVWSAPIRLAEGVEPEQLKIELVFNGQVCQADDTGEIVGCDVLKNRKTTALFAGFDPKLAVSAPETDETPEQNVEPFKPPLSHVTWAGKVVREDGIKAVISPGDTVSLKITATPLDGFHIYAYEHQKTGEINSTLFAFTNDNGWNAMKPKPSAKPEKNQELGYSGHHKPVTWSFEINIPEDAEPKNYTLNGLIGFQTCTNTCDPPDGVKFSAIVPIGSGTPAFPVTFESGIEYSDAEAVIKTKIGKGAADSIDVKNPASLKSTPDTPAQIAEMATLYDVKKPINYLLLNELDANPVGSSPENLVRNDETTLGSAVVLIFLGGILLNLMPCVFPVLGLKVMGFVEQAGSDPKKIRMHGIAFTLGLVFSMWVLAGIVLMLKFTFGRNVSWGAEQMGNPYFVGAIIILLFLLGLNMAGVFEMGTSMTRVGGGVSGKKGYTSSFLSGILTTLIATPCSGPFLGAAMGYTLAQPAAIAMFLFTVFALGIAFPYIALSFFPALINKLPRPGAWMHTFKVTMAFALFATVAFFMQTFGGQTGVDGLSWLAMALVVIGLAAFFYGTWSPAYVKPNKRFWFGWLMPALIAGVGIWMSYDAMNYRNSALASHDAGGLDWQEWNPGKIEYMLDKKPKIVWVDYTADW